MLCLTIPGRPGLHIHHLVCDFNGTLAVDGQLIPGLKPLFTQLAEHLDIYVITADTYGTVQQQVANLPCQLHVLESALQDVAKQDFIKALGAEHVVAIGNGLNDALMLQQAALGFAVLQQEGLSVASLNAADLLFASVQDALQSLLQSHRLVASLRV